MKIIEIAKGKLGRGVHQSAVSATSRYSTRATTRVTLSLPASRRVTSNILIKQTCPKIRQVPISAPRHERRKINVP